MTGFESVDTAAAQHLTGPEEFQGELESLQKHITSQLSEVNELAEQADAIQT